MDLLIVIARLLLAAVFAVSGVAKLLDRAGTRRALADFGVPVALVRPAGVLLPAAELAVAASLALTPAAWWGALGALVLLAAFVVVLSVSLARGRRPDCRCFGQLGTSPIGWGTVARNVALMIAAALVLWPGPGATPGWGDALAAGSPADRGALLVGAAAAIPLAALSWLVLQLWRQQGRLLARIEALEHGRAAPREAAPGLPIGTPAPEFRVTTLSGEERTLATLRASDRPLLLLFTDPGCGPYTALLPRLVAWQREHAERVRIVPVSRGSARDNRAKVAAHGVADLVLQHDWEVSDLFRVPGTPAAVLLTSDGRVASPVASSERGIGELVAYALAGPRVVAPADQPHAPAARIAPKRLRAGDRVPSLSLATLDGRQVDLADSLAGETVLLFWNPHCGFCERMVGDLREWAATRPPAAPNLVVISVGDPAANRTLAVPAPVLLDDTFTAAPRFGAPGTPSAVLVDEQKRIASPVAEGATAVLDLLRRTAVAI